MFRRRKSGQSTWKAGGLEFQIHFQVMRHTKKQIEWKVPCSTCTLTLIIPYLFGLRGKWLDDLEQYIEQNANMENKHHRAVRDA